MPHEIERKFLLKNDGWKSAVIRQLEIKQGYLNTDPKRTIRIRLQGEQGYLTIKGESRGISRQEFEYEIPYEDARHLILLCEPPIIEKNRYEVQVHEHLWEIDVFEGANEGLIIAEVELASETEIFHAPPWLGQEVSADLRYYNSMLAQKPFSSW